MTSLSLNLNWAIDRHEKLTYNRLVNSIDKSLDSNCFDAFHVLFTDEMSEPVINNTNDKIKHIKENLPPHFVELNKNTYVRLLDQEGFYVFIGLLYARGLSGQSMHTYKILFSETAGHRIFTATMSKHRFTFLSAVLTFDNPEEQRELWESDRFAAARRLTAVFNEQMKNVLDPSKCLSIDETLYSMRHQINFRQYNPNKPAKYDLLYKSLNDADFGFTYQVIPYCSRPESGSGPYYLSSTEDYVKSLVNAMPRSSVKGKNISMDRLYTSISTANWLLKNEITVVVGTLVTNRIVLPDDLKNAKKQGKFESIMHWEKTKGDLPLCTYTTKSKSKGKKIFLVLSTMRPLMDITSDNGKQKPAIIKFYDFTKRGTDVMDQKISKYSCKLLTHRWTMIHFFFLMHSIRCNAGTSCDQA